MKYAYFFLLFWSVWQHALAVENEYSLTQGKVVDERGTFSYQVDIADNTVERAVGLMYRNFLHENSGMLFVFDEEKVHRVWMKDMLIAIDVVFLSTDGYVVSLLHGLQPCKAEDDCKAYDSKVRAKYMLELRAGEIVKKQIEIGAKVVIQ
jgi:uncharacterized protein